MKRFGIASMEAHESRCGLPEGFVLYSPYVFALAVARRTPQRGIPHSVPWLLPLRGEHLVWYLAVAVFLYSRAAKQLARQREKEEVLALREALHSGRLFSTSGRFPGSPGPGKSRPGTTCN